MNQNLMDPKLIVLAVVMILVIAGLARPCCKRYNVSRLQRGVSVMCAEQLTNSLLKRGRARQLLCDAFAAGAKAVSVSNMPPNLVFRDPRRRYHLRY